MHLLRQHRAAVVFVAAIGLSCLSGPRPPVVTPSRTLAAGTEGASAIDEGPFRVVAASPRGKTVDASEVSIVFNRPMRPLELAGEDETAPPATIVVEGGAPPRGSWRWLGTSALSFVPTEPLPRATQYRVTVPQGTKALDGSVLSSAYTFEFTRPRPTLTRTDPWSGFESLKPTQSIELLFDQPIGLEAIEKHVKLLAGDEAKARKIGVKAGYPKPDVRGRIRITPATPLPLDSAVTLSIGAELRGLEGPLPVGETKSVPFRTYGPLVVRAVDCYRDTPHKRCAAREGVRIELSQRVRLRDLAAHVSIEPGVKLDWTGQLSSRRDADDLVSSIHLPARLAPARSYRVVLRAGLKDEFGQTLATTRSAEVVTDDEWPDVEVGIVGSVFDSTNKAPPAIPVASVNVPELEVAGAAFDEASYARWMFEEKRARPSFDRLAAVSGARKDMIKTAAPRNTRALRQVDLATLIGKPVDRGLFAFAVRAPGRAGRIERVHALSSTDLGISAKMSRFGSLVWVTRLSTGKPVAGASVSVRKQNGDQAFSGTTNADGLVTIPGDRFDPSTPRDREDETDGLVFARLGADLAVRRVRDMISPWRFTPNSDPSGRLDPVGFVFTDRGVYRPGETIRAKGLFRMPTPRGTTTPVGRAVDVRGFDPQGQEVFKTSMRLGEFGDFAVDVPVPASARLGSFEVRAELAKDGEDRGVASATAELAAYKASEFKVSVEPDRPAYVRGDKATFSTRGDYLFGAPMKGGKVRTFVRRGSGFFALPLGENVADAESAYVWDDETYFRDKPNAAHRASLITSSEGELGAKGELALPVPLTLPEQRGTETVRVESDVEDITRQTVAADASAIVHPGEYYVALARAGDGFVAEGAGLSPNVLAVEPGGKRRSGVAVTIELVRRTWSSVLRGAGESDVTSETRVTDEIVEKCSVVTRESVTSCALTPRAAGYHVVRATSRDPRGNVVGASYGLYVLAARDTALPSWPSHDAATVELVPDKKAYAVGDTATVLVKSPFSEAEALVTVERAGIYKSERRVLKGATPTLRVPITGDMAPNAFVGVHLLRPRTKDRPIKGPDVGAPAYRIGYAELKLRTEDRRLKVVVTPSAKELRPGQDVDVDVAVTDQRGQPVRANATFYAVDEGVLMLTGYKTPDPLPTFSAPRPLAVFSIESREDLARIFRLSPSAPGEDKGSEGGGGGEGMRADFRATAFFEPSLLVDRGRAKTRFKLPDSLTTYRLMAVVADGGERFGFGEAQVVTSRRLMLRPALPRFFRAGDFVDAGVVVTSKGLPATTVDVGIQTQGLALDGPTMQRVSVPASGQTEVRFRLRPTQAGDAVLSFTAQAPDGRGGIEKDALRLTKKIEIPTTVEAVALAGATESASAEQLGNLQALRSDVGGLEISMSSSALVGLDGAVKQVLEYPYGCTEQLTSRLVPLVFASDILPFVGAAPPADAKRIVADTIGKILKAQRSDGGFGFWSDSASTDRWLTAYVTWALAEAKKRGHHVPQAALDTAKIRLRKWNTRLDLERELSLAEAAFTADVLATVDTPDGGLMSELYEKREKLPLFARALLAHAYAISPASKMTPRDAIIADLLRDVENHVRPTPTGAMVVSNHGTAYAPLLDSDVRTTALSLRAMVTANPKHPLAARLARGLVGARHGGAFRSTQEAGFALVALDDYRRAQEKTSPELDARVFLGERMLKEHHFAGPGSIVERVPAAQLGSAGGNALTFQALGEGGRLFYEARLRYARRDLPTAPLERGFFVRKTLRSVKPEALEEAIRSQPKTSSFAFNAGDLVLVDLHVVSTSPRTHVVVDDPLPAGFEALDARIRTTSGAAAMVEAASAPREHRDGHDDEGEGEGDDEDERASGRAEIAAPFHRETHDDRVLTFVERMPAGLLHFRYLARATSRGRFLIPATRAECMYEPEIFGRTAGAVYEVK